MRLRFKLLITFICLLTIGSGAIAQTIIIKPDNFSDDVLGQVISYETFFVNGSLTYGLTDKMAEAHYKLGVFTKLSLSTVTLRLVSEGKIKLRESISYTLPEIIERNPFRVAVTPAHIMTETGGFAAPAVFSNTPLSFYATHMRTAGQIAHHDIVGWAILARFLEEKTGQSIDDILKEHLLIPLGLKTSDLTATNSSSLLQFVDSLTGSGAFIAEVSRLLIRNQTASGDRYLSRNLHNALVKDHSWRMHPLAPNHTFGAAIITNHKWQWLEPANIADEALPIFMAFPDTGVTFVKLTGKDPAFKQAVLTIADDSFLPQKPTYQLNEANSLAPPYQPFSGSYVRDDQPSAVRDDQPSAWLKKRLNAIENEKIQLLEPTPTTISLTTSSSETTSTIQFNKRAPFYYTSEAGNELIMSPYRSGGYFLLDGVLHRYIGVLGNRLIVISLFPYAVILLLSSVLYAKNGISKAWRRMGQYGSVGALMICAGLLCDYLWWPSAIFEWQMPYLVNIWRAIMNIGLMLILSMPIFALSFTKKNHMPEGKAIFLAPAHLAFLTFASLTLFLILVAWGVAGEFSAY